jgi:hypothetical protein
MLPSAAAPGAATFPTASLPPPASTGANASGESRQAQTTAPSNVPVEAAASPSAPAPIIGAAEQVRGLSCVTGGLMAATGSWAFTQFVAGATIAGSTWPVALPLMATAFVTGCSVGSMSLPAFFVLFTADAR